MGAEKFERQGVEGAPASDSQGGLLRLGGVCLGMWSRHSRRVKRIWRGKEGVEQGSLVLSGSSRFGILEFSLFGHLAGPECVGLWGGEAAGGPWLSEPCQRQERPASEVGKQSRRGDGSVGHRAVWDAVQQGVLGGGVETGWGRAP